MADKHLNLFYTYNRDNELIENNLTRAFIVFLSIVSGQVRHKILSTLLERSGETVHVAANDGGLNFEDASFALQSHIDPRLAKNSDRQALLTISTEPLDVPSATAAADANATGESENEGTFPSAPASVPDAWVYDDGGSYCVLIEAKVGTYPLEAAQLQAHARGWLGRSLQNLESNGSLFSVTWIDVLRTLRDVLNDHPVDHSEERLLSHMMQFIGYYNYPLWDDFDFGGLNAPPDWVIGGTPTSPENTTPSPGSPVVDFRQLAPPPNFVLMSCTSDPQEGFAR